MKQSASNQSVQQRGAVSLIVVIFTALLVTVITIGFVSLMVRSQQQATQSDLSQSAYDSALIGLEDAKRVLLLDKKCKETNDTASPVLCPRIRVILEADPSTQTCSDVKKMLTNTEGETLVGENVGEQKLLQAYSCAKISPNTVDYRAQNLGSAKSHIIPLTVAPGASFDSIEIMWFTQQDAAATDVDGEYVDTDLSWPSPGNNDTPLPIPDGDTWKSQMPPILRTQLMQVAKPFTLSQFDAAGGLGDTNSSTLFLYPHRDLTEEIGFNSDPSPGTKAPRLVKCDETRFEEGDYACKVTLAVPNPVTGSASNRTAFLRLSALYNTTRYRIVLKSGGTTVPFYGVQPEVDVTGRANDVYRRIKARVQLDAEYPYPESAVDLNGNLCKDFTVTGDANTYDDVNRVERCNPRGSSD